MPDLSGISPDASCAPAAPPPVFSVIVPAFNAGATLEKTLDSLLLQSIDNSLYEILVIDDGSSDNSHAVARAAARKTTNLRLLRNSANLGPGAARNRGIREAAGRYACFVDADDTLQSYALEVFLQKVRSHEPQAVYANINRVSAYGEILKSICRHDRQTLVEKTINGENTFCVVSAVYSRKFLLENSLFFPENMFYEDMLFAVSCVLLAKRIVTVNAVLYHWIERPGSTTTSMGTAKIVDAVTAIEQIYALLCKTGFAAAYLPAWQTLATQFLALISRRINAQGENPPAQHAVLCERIRQSAPFSRLNMQKRLVSALAPPGAAQAGKAPSTASLIRGAADAVVMVAETDYHVRNYVPISRELARLGIQSMLCDFSGSSCFTHPRRIPQEELQDYADTAIYQYDGKTGPALFTNARAYVFSIDWGRFHPLLVEVKRYGIPAIGFYEGISDDFLCHPANAQKLLPYRNVPFLLVPGAYYKGIYTKQDVRVTGLPVIRSLLAEPVSFPEKTTAVINVNFSYRVLKHCRDLFLSSAMQGCQAAGIGYVLSRHPADTAQLPPQRVSSDSVYECLKKGSLLISRFSTCVLEALALGKPVIYHNPHDEKFPKFQDPMGAYRISRTEEELARALRETEQDIRSGVDFRKKAESFLRFHANAFTGLDPARLAAEAIQQIIRDDSDNFMHRILHHPGHIPSRTRYARPQPQPSFSHLLKALFRSGKANILAAWHDPGLLSAAIRKMFHKQRRYR